MKNNYNQMVDITHRVYALRHIETGEYICLRQEGHEYLACFSDGDTSLQFRDELGLLEHVDMVLMPIGEAPFDYFWLDGEMIGRNVLTDDRAARR
jgi:hypothetical protein